MTLPLGTPLSSIDIGASSSRNTSLQDNDNNAKRGNRETPPNAFDKYSDDVARMRRILLKREDEEFDVRRFADRHYGLTRLAAEFSSDGERVPGDDRRARKTAISFEVCPSLIYDDMFEQLDRMSDEEVDRLASDLNMPQGR
eukprot:CAMPEP_0172533212 /NCGR_PEP_ID=MMETSP1067-20121228/5999_1 /TAXON_ID=265564 ORGANISM="Thalassiosira punctigera, Strain Tpunct2005C2" /NCGR_SAMPLE_ID=MMETSP1067 /ASSEMBLY_ACC=CAM_ASM_000444 /LENGTH=141 /DNA_ID=CAMNT_0013317827 /DNA_START=130 /DNA_END=555 /DNA_ORIENTATION=+